MIQALNILISFLFAIGLTGCVGFLGYKAILWGFATQSIWKMIFIWGGWLLIALIGAFTTGGIGRLAHPMKDIFGLVFGILWAVLLIAAVVYSWCQPPYTTGLIILRVFWSYFALGSSVWAFIMVSMISSQK